MVLVAFWKVAFQTLSELSVKRFTYAASSDISTISKSTMLSPPLLKGWISVIRFSLSALKFQTSLNVFPLTFFAKPLGGLSTDALYISLERASVLIMVRPGLNVDLSMRRTKFNN